MKIIPRWKWENIWLVFIVTSCILMPVVMVVSSIRDLPGLIGAAPRGAVLAAAGFGFSWGFGAILFGLSVHRLGVSLANSLVIGLSSALGSLVPLVLAGAFRLQLREAVLIAGIATFLVGVWLCGKAGCLREAPAGSGATGPEVITGILFSVGAGIMSAVFNIGYALALPIASAGERLGYSGFDATNAIWLLMLGFGSLPNIAFCSYLLGKNGTGKLFAAPERLSGFGLSILMGLLWGASIFLYGAAAPRLGDIGPSIGWPLSLAVALLVANLMGFLLREWRDAGARAIRYMRFGIATLVAAIVICAASTQVGG